MCVKFKFTIRTWENIIIEHIVICDKFHILFQLITCILNKATLCSLKLLAESTLGHNKVITKLYTWVVAFSWTHILGRNKIITKSHTWVIVFFTSRTLGHNNATTKLYTWVVASLLSRTLGCNKIITKS